MAMAVTNNPMRVLEFYSGIGGLVRDNPPALSFFILGVSFLQNTLEEFVRDKPSPLGCWLRIAAKM